MPQPLEPIAAKAKARLRHRHANPGVSVEVETELARGYRLASPHSDHDSWEAMICDALGTRSISTAKTFVQSLTQLCSRNFHSSGVEGEYGEWVPDEFELNMVLNIATSIKPRNEMEAALAAQMTAVHLMTMKVAAQALECRGLNERALALSSKLARTFSLQWEALMRSRGKRRSTRQNIVVTHEKHIHHHQHVHLARGVSEIGGQACEPNNRNERPDSRGTALVEHEGRPALPGPNASGVVVPMPRQQGEGPMPTARRSKRIGSTKG
jgi:hypothetical protein